MTFDMYTLSVPVFARGLKNLIHILDKGAAHAAAKNFDQNVLLGGRIFPDMFPLSRQVQIATDITKGCVARLAGVEIPSYSDTETSFAELIGRVERTLDFFASFKPEQFGGSAEKQIVLTLRTRTLEFPGMVYLQTFAVPNMYFHITTTYNLLRHVGVELGKQDFLGQ